MMIIDEWVIEALVFMFGGIIAISIAAWFVEQFDKDR
jgi:hypothetical protein